MLLKFIKPSWTVKKKGRQGSGDKTKDTIVVAVEKTKSDCRSGRNWNKIAYVMKIENTSADE